MTRLKYIITISQIGECFPHLGKFSQQRGKFHNLAHKPATLATQTTLMLSEWKFSVIKLKTWEGYLPQPKLCTDHSCWQLSLTPIQGSLWRSSGIRVRIGSICRLCPLHFGCSQTWRGTWPWCSPLCRWHPTLWPLFTCQFFWVGVSSSSSYWLNSRVDVLKPAFSQHGQDTIHLAWYEAQCCQERCRSALQSTSVPDWTFIYEESWLHYRSRVKHEGPNHQTLPVVLLPASSNTHGLTLTYIISHPNAGPCGHAFICTRVGFSNSLLYGTSTYLLDRLQSAAIRHDLRWLPVPFRIRHKLNSITSNCLLWRAVHRSTWSSYM